MPYIIKPVKGGFKVCKEDNKRKCFSKKPLKKDVAERQKIAIIISENKKRNK